MPHRCNLLSPLARLAHRRTALFVLTAPVLLGTLATAAGPQPSRAETPMIADSPLLKPWPGPHGGVPPWDQVNADDFLAAFEVALELAKNQIDAIAKQSDPPTIENTVLALDASGAELERVETLFDVHAGNLNLGPIPEIERVISPKLSEHADRVIQNAELFARIESIWQAEEANPSSPVRRRLVDDRYQSFVRRGAKLSSEDKQRLSAINSRLASLFTDFNQNVLEDEKRYVTWIEDAADLAGLPESTVAAMAAAAAERRATGETPSAPASRWAVTNTRSSMDPFLTYADSRELRERVWRIFYSRCDHGDEFDNKPVITEILALRLERARLLGYATHADWRMQRTMAETPATAMGLMLRVWPKAVARVREEVADMQRIADLEADRQGTPKIRIEPWDYRYYAERVRKEKYDLDFNEVEPYLQLDRLVEGMTWAAGELFGMRFEPAPEYPTFHPDVRVWRVTDAQGVVTGLFYLDPYAREGKRSGAWMSEYRAQYRSPSVSIPIVSNNSNFVKSSEGQPVLISWDDAVTLFHEFGHALHGLLSQVDYKAQAGTRVARDYVEFPSQVFEHWLMTDEVLGRFALHHETGQPMPSELLQRIRKAAQFNQGFGTVEYLASAIMDMKLHTDTTGAIDPAAFEREVLAEIGMPPEMVMRHRLPHFLHLFSSDSYSAGYYSYLWSDALTADAAEAFEQSPGGYFDRELARALKEHVLSVGDTIDPAESFRLFRGRDVDTTALLRKRGFPID
ncbi:MAG: M3 family peptidase [Planctomycetaceae bacterium]|nr:MAG: M3 family peptidase [Planctomycetaceae bacterium]